MLAGQFTATRTVQLLNHPEPQLPDAELQPGQIVFQPELTCLCGSDLPFFDGNFEGHTIAYPQPVGMSLHEMVGTIVATNGRKWQPGTRVLAVPIGQMGLMERFVMPEDQAIALRPGLRDELCLLAQPLGTVLHALKKLPNMIDRDVVVLGQGPIGQMFNAALRNLGARRIIGIDPEGCRLAASHQMGATHVVCGCGRDVIAEIRDLLDGRFPEFVIEAVGHKAHALNDAIELVNDYGTILFFGVPPEKIDGVALRSAMWKNAQIITSLHPDFSRTYPLAMQWLGENRINLSPLLTHRFPLKHIQQAFDTFRDRTGGALKVLVEFPALTHPR
jgi:threonine dehydrogenase-like Zn-dependent dehydrogenase